MVIEKAELIDQHRPKRCILAYIIESKYLNPIMIGIGIYMFVASIPVMIIKKWDYGRIFKERKLKKEAKRL